MKGFPPLPHPIVQQTVEELGPLLKCRCSVWLADPLWQTLRASPTCPQHPPLSLSAQVRHARELTALEAVLNQRLTQLRATYFSWLAPQVG